MTKSDFYFFNKNYQEVITKISDNSIDLIVTDPPYPVSNQSW